MKKVIVNENQRGILFKNGRFSRLLMPGKYRVFGDANVELFHVEPKIISERCTVDMLHDLPEIAAETAFADVPDNSVALRFVGGCFKGFLCPGKHLFWRRADGQEIKIVDISEPEVGADIPRYIFSKSKDNINSMFFTRVDVAHYEKARLYYNKRFVRLLEPGTYFFWNGATAVDVETVDMRVRGVEIVGQELLTRDKVTVRINFALNYRVVDCVRIATEVDDYERQIYLSAQLALREYVGRYPLDQLLESRDELAEYVLSALKAKEAQLFVAFSDAGVKDIILPGEIRDIMNTVLIAEKKAQASVISRREEVASTRSLLNTAKLMDENKTLYKLKELEYVERICENVGNINIGGGDILSGLTDLLSHNEGAGAS